MEQEEARLAGVVRVLQGTAIFAGLPAEDLMLLAAGARQQSYGVQQTLAGHEFDEAVLVVARGMIRLFRCCEAGGEVTLGTFPAGAVLGVSPSAAAVMTASTMEVVEQNTLLHGFSRQRVDALLHRNPEFAFRVIEHLGQGVEALCGRVEELALHPVRARLAHELGCRAHSDAQDQVRDTHEELAAWIGSSQVEVTRELRVLRAEGLIASNRHCRGITVLDPAKLANYQR